MAPFARVAAEPADTTDALLRGELWGREWRELKANPTEGIHAAIRMIDGIE